MILQEAEQESLEIFYAMREELRLYLKRTQMLETILTANGVNVIKLAAKEEAAEDHRILKELQKELIRKKRQQKQTEAAPSEKGYRKGQRAEA